MKRLSILAFVSISLFLWSCGGSNSNDSANKEKEKSAFSEMKEMQSEVAKMAENAKKIQAEEAKESEADKAIFSDKNIALLELSTTEQKIPNEVWKQAATLRENYKALSNEELRALTHEKIEQMILDAGFTDIDSAKTSLREIADSRDLIIGMSMQIGNSKTVRLIDGEEAYLNEMKELGAKVNEKGYSGADLKAMDKNLKVATSVTEILYRLNH